MSYGVWLGVDRLERAHRMYAAPDQHIVRRPGRGGSWIVRSQRVPWWVDPQITYRVRPGRSGVRSCTCNDFVGNILVHANFACKHILLVDLVLSGGGPLLRPRAQLDAPQHIGAWAAGGATAMDAVVGHFAVRAPDPRRAFVIDIATGAPVCAHVHDEAGLRAWFGTGAADEAGAPCPACIGMPTPPLIAAVQLPATAAGRTAWARQVGTLSPAARLVSDMIAAADELIVGGGPVPSGVDIRTAVVNAAVATTEAAAAGAGATPEQAAAQAAAQAAQAMATTEGDIQPRNAKDTRNVAYAATRYFNSRIGNVKHTELLLLWKLWKPGNNAAGTRTSNEELELSGNRRTRTTAELVAVLRLLVFTPAARITAIPPPKDGTRPKRSIAIWLHSHRPRLQARIFGRSRCGEEPVRELGLADLDTHQQIIRDVVEYSADKTDGRGHSILLYHDTGSGKTATLWAALGAAWANGRTKKYAFVTKRTLANRQQPRRDVWAFYDAAGDNSHATSRRPRSCMTTTRGCGTARPTRTRRREGRLHPASCRTSNSQTRAGGMGSSGRPCTASRPWAPPPTPSNAGISQRISVILQTPTDEIIYGHRSPTNGGSARSTNSSQPRRCSSSSAIS